MSIFRGPELCEIEIQRAVADARGARGPGGELRIGLLTLLTTVISVLVLHGMHRRSTRLITSAS